MVPTLRFRQVEITWSVACGPDNTAFFHRNGRRNKGDKITGYKLQQWWSLSGASPEFIAQLNYPPDHEGWRDGGEWRSVEIVEE